MAIHTRGYFCSLVIGVIILIMVTLSVLYRPHLERVMIVINQDQTTPPSVFMRLLRDSSLSLANNSVLNLAAPELRRLEGAFTAVWVDKAGPLEERLKAMEEMILLMRDRMVAHYKDLPWNVSSGPLRVIDAREVSHLTDISHSGAVIPIFLPWIPQEGGTTDNPLNTLSDASNLLIQRYYPWIAEPTLCDWIKTGVTNMRYHIVFNYKCTSDRSEALKPTSLELVTLNARPANKILFPTYPPFYYTDLPKHVVYMMLAKNALFTHVFGDLIADGVKYVPYTCGRDIKPQIPPGLDQLPVYDEVFSITQYWGNGFYHKNIEDFPRLAAFLPMLRNNPQIKVHVAEKGGFTTKLLGYLGISADRLVTGNIKAKIGYMPESINCGFGHVPYSQLLNKEYRNVIHNKFNQTKRSSIVLIRRSGGRRLTSHNEVEAMLRRVAEENKLVFELFIDNPPPPIEEAMKMFNRAVMVVAPHGAGLSNLIFSEPETFVIEGVCNRPHVNLCYQRQAYIQGQHYHAIQSKGGCEGVVNIDAKDIENLVRTYIPHAVKLAVR